MLIEEDKSLRDYNTFGIDSRARYFISVNDIDELRQALKLDLGVPVFILGGGSNLLLPDRLDYLVIHVNLKGIQWLEENENECLLEVAAGENWHEFVNYCLDHDLGGLENLSLIPGNVGTAPVQNIGAYGVELVDTFVECQAMNVDTGELHTFDKAACQFGYRNSVFKGELKGLFVICSVTFRLSRGNHTVKTAYGAIQDELKKAGVTQPSIRDVADAVISIRSSKLPDPAKLGNSGSFFKNPVITDGKYLELQVSYPDMPAYPQGEGMVKVPAGWLIESSGLKGYRKGDAGVHARQALVLVNYGKASSKEIWDLALLVQGTVEEKFGIRLEPEVNVI